MESFLPYYTKKKRIPDDLNLLAIAVKEMSESEFLEYSEKLRKYFLLLYEKYHFPACVIKGRTLEKIIRDFKRFNNNSFSDIFLKGDNGKKDIINCFDKSFSGVNHWFPEMYDVKRASSKMSVMDPFRDKKIFHRNFSRLIRDDVLKFQKKNKAVLVSETLNGFRILNGIVPLSNFPSGVAKFLYSKVLNKECFKNQNELRILDQSMGWAGRMLGILSATTQGLFGNKKVYYHGTDVNTLVHDRFAKIYNFWQKYVTNENIDKFNFFKSTVPAEDLIKKEPFFQDKLETYDMSFTSPPYFNTEQYSDDNTQSFKRYDSYEKWSEGFLQNMISNTYQLLKPGGECWINIADVKINSSKDYSKAYLPLEKDTIKYAEKCGFEYKGKLKMLLTTLSGTGTTPGTRQRVIGKNIAYFNNQATKYEPIFYFKKS